MPAEREKPRITIEVSGGMIQNVFTTLETEVEVDILDLDDNGAMTKKERDDIREYLKCAASNQRRIY